MQNAYQIYHRKYGDICGDSWYGKHATITNLAIVYGEESEVKDIVDDLNKANNSYYAEEEPVDEYDDDFCDEDYYSYEEVKFVTPEMFRANNSLLMKRGKQNGTADT